MSKVVKSVGRAIGKVVKGVVKAVKSVAKSKIGKIILVAAAVYFGGAALLGATGTSGAAAAGGLSGLSGATANISAAWTSLGSATTAAMQGKFLAAGDALTSGFAGNAVSWTAPSVAAGAAGTAVPAAVAPVAEGAAVAAPAAAAPAAAVPASVPAAVPAAVGSGSVAPAALPPISSGAAGANGYAALGNAMKTGAYINAGTALVGGLVNNRAAEGQREFEMQQAQAARDRYNANAGSMWWGSPAGGSNVYAQPAPTGLIAGAMTPSQRYAEDVRARMQTYDPYAVRRG